MTKRTILLESKTHKGLVKGKKLTLNISTPIYKVKQRLIETELGSFDVLITLDFFGRLKAVYIERSKLI